MSQVSKVFSFGAIAKLLAFIVGPPLLGALAVSLTINVANIEQNITAIITVLVFSIPLISSVCVLGIRYLYNVEKAWKEAQASRLATQDVGTQVAANTSAIEQLAKQIGVVGLPTNPPPPHIDTAGLDPKDVKE